MLIIKDSIFQRHCQTCSSKYKGWTETEDPIHYEYVHQIVADFQNSFTTTISRKFAIKQLLNIPPHHKCIATLHYVRKPVLAHLV